MTTLGLIFVVFSFARLGMASLGLLPEPTHATSDGRAMNEWLPTPTARAELLKRQNVPQTTCGYFNGNAAALFDCGNEYCGYNSYYGWFGCCRTTTFYSGTAIPTDCPIRTSCVQYVDLNKCTGSCADDQLVLRCTNAASPYCITATVMETTGFTLLGCSTAPLLIGVLQTPTTYVPPASQSQPSSISVAQTQPPATQLILPTAAATTLTTSAVPNHIINSAGELSVKQASFGIVGAIVAAINLL